MPGWCPLEENFWRPRRASTAAASGSETKRLVSENVASDTGFRHWLVSETTTVRQYPPPKPPHVPEAITGPEDKEETRVSELVQNSV